MGLSLEIARRAAAVTHADLDAGALGGAKASLIDGLAVMAGARGHEPGAEAMIAHALAFAGQGPASIIGERERTSPAMAALANGALAHALDFEDTFEEGMIHPNASVIPAVLALGQHLSSDGRSVLAALALGCDFACRLSLALSGDPAGRGWYHPPMISGMGAALACASLLRLPPPSIVDALGLAACQFALDDELKRSPHSSLRAVRDGFAARAAVEGALMAAAGVRAVEEPLEGRNGFAARLTGRPPDGDVLLDGFGRRFHGAQVGLKRWPSCRGTHAAVAAALDLHGRGFEPEALETVAVTVTPPNDMLFDPRAQRIRPSTAIDARFSIPFVFATTLRRGSIDLAGFDGAARGDPATLALAERVVMEGMVSDAGFEARFRVLPRRGRAFTIEIGKLPVWRAGTAGGADLAEKVSACLRHGGMSDVAAAALIEAAETVETSGIEPLLSLLSPNAPR